MTIEIALPFIAFIFFVVLLIKVGVVSTEVKQEVNNNGAGGAGGPSVFGGAGGGGGGGNTIVQNIGTVNSKDKLLYSIVSLAGALVSLADGIIKLVNP